MRVTTGGLHMGEACRMISQTISHYKIVEKLGGGGMGVVYKATDTRLHRFGRSEIPSTRSHSRCAGPSSLSTRSAGGLGLEPSEYLHIYDIGEQDGQAFIAMEYLEGTTLKHLIRGTPLDNERLPPGDRYRRCLGCCAQRGDCASRHQAGKYFCNQAGTAKILDFGLAKLTVATDGAGKTMTVEATAVEETEHLTHPGST